jgi:hypothetical protein
MIAVMKIIDYQNPKADRGARQPDSDSRGRRVRAGWLIWEASGNKATVRKVAITARQQLQRDGRNPAVA